MHIRNAALFKEIFGRNDDAQLEELERHRITNRLTGRAFFPHEVVRILWSVEFELSNVLSLSIGDEVPVTSTVVWEPAQHRHIVEEHVSGPGQPAKVDRHACLLRNIKVRPKCSAVPDKDLEKVIVVVWCGRNRICTRLGRRRKP